jgi:hypothetical protein
MQKPASQTTQTWHRVENPEACELLTDRALLRVLAQFTGRENTMANAAKSLEMTIGALYKILKRFEGLGLVTVTRTEARAGRAIQHYRTVAEAFFVPFRTHPPERISVQNWALHQALFRRGLDRLYREERFVEQDWGVLTAIAPNGGVYLEITSASGRAWADLIAEGPAVVSGWHAVYLGIEDAKALQRELDDVLARYLSKRGPRKYLLGAFLTDVDGLE